jgi:hypothetical protein
MLLPEMYGGLVVKVERGARRGLRPFNPNASVPSNHPAPDHSWAGVGSDRRALTSGQLRPSS